MELSAKIKIIKKKTCLQLFATVVSPKLFCMLSCPWLASIHFFTTDWLMEERLCFTKFASTKLQGTAHTVEDKVRIQHDLNRL